MSNQHFDWSTVDPAESPITYEIKTKVDAAIAEHGTLGGVQAGLSGLIAAVHRLEGEIRSRNQAD
ncbi:hypothetical protein [Nocardia sp. NPDC059236]|uniref:hypothetical protein n=1 Tax=Nocardia sp. NPDC059236 TaxID=3346783 RepID=UPI00369B6A94